MLGSCYLPGIVSPCEKVSPTPAEIKAEKVMGYPFFLPPPLALSPHLDGGAPEPKEQTRCHVCGATWGQRGPCASGRDAV